MFIPAEIIKKKRNGDVLNSSEIEYFIQAFTSGRLPEYQMSALLMAIYFNGLNVDETIYLTQAMMKSGVELKYEGLSSKPIDKHSTGGVGDKTSLILAPIAAAAGVPVPMISGRGLGHTGGTLDKLESIPGFNIHLSLSQFVENVKKYNLCFIGQTSEICPADKKMYALRDVTATVENSSLICASIMSKKLAEGAEGIVFDVKWGNGAFIKKREEAESLALSLARIAKGAGRKVQIVISDMNQPLGRFSGNALEVEECLDILKGKSYFNSLGQDLYKDTRELSLVLSSLMIWMSGRSENYEEARLIAERTLNNGEALRKFEEICKLQGGDLSKLPKAKYRFEVRAPQSGYIHEIQTEKLGVLCIHLGAGRRQISDKIDPTSGFEILFKLGDPVQCGEVLFVIYGSDSQLLSSLEEEFKNVIRWSDFPVSFPHVDQISDSQVYSQGFPQTFEKVYPQSFPQELEKSEITSIKTLKSEEQSKASQCKKENSNLKNSNQEQKKQENDNEVGEKVELDNKFVSSNLNLANSIQDQQYQGQPQQSQQSSRQVQNPNTFIPDPDSVRENSDLTSDPSAALIPPAIPLGAPSGTLNHGSDSYCHQTPLGAPPRLYYLLQCD